MVAGAVFAVALGLGAGWAGYKVKLPAGPLTGGMLGVGTALAVVGFPDLAPSAWLGQLLQVAVGILVGMRLDRHSVALLPRYLLPAVGVAAAFVVAGFLISLYLAASTSLDAQTALFASLPGGLTELIAIGSSIGADGPIIAAVQLVRLLSVLLLLNFLLVIVRRKGYVGVAGVGSGREFRDENGWLEAADHGPEKITWHSSGVTSRLLVFGGGIATGVLGLASGFPAGGVIGAMLGSAAVRVSTGSSMPTHNYQVMVQAAAGLIIGFQINDDFFRSLAEVGGAAAIITVIHLVLWVTAFYVLYSCTSYGGLTSMLAAAPGGMSELTSTAGSVGADSLTVALTHITRVMFIVAAAPLLVSVFAG